MLSTCYVALAVLFLTTLIGDLTAEEPIAGKNTRCWCEQENGCRNAPETTGSNVEVILVSKENSSTAVWKWDSFSTVITTFSTAQETPMNKIACEAHHRGKKYGFIMPLPKVVNNTFSETDQKEVISTISKRSQLCPDSYLDTADQQRCEAVPTIPFTEFIYGIEQYLNLNRIPLVVGIPWHGYDYTCELLKLQNTDGTCDITKHRKRMSLAAIHEENYFDQKKVTTDQLTQAAYLTYPEKDTSVHHLVWFENADTLTIKYKIVNLLPVKDTVAGAAIGCLLLGTALGITFTCIALRRCKRSPPKRPFKLDEAVDDFHDDPGL
ncbi:hypothetical protein C0Q70_05020 [Pomacea canaliculata]|uniref:Uncharacterized protein n=1 Tax=Pomacea canaliculata TaxID=400727 RepID=A0A2T7PK28_POMCA|nr:hypothetical protein C0Q70_05020 [Pomacea canaliculata]